MAIQNSSHSPSFVNEVVKIVEDKTIVRSNLKLFPMCIHGWKNTENHRTRNGIFDLLYHLEQGLCSDLNETNLTTLNQEEERFPFRKQIQAISWRKNVYLEF
ncbi:hypothetical protein AVEN_112788-1 [Araneus ventricosus]|uniref:Uncharacterized protein n=1 Tax=Araneus ventricosus TaxID=182803 RepID=A0A4Y2JAQ3_ARAVE|nr:hypothetical protein AVEN_112788-1 [Araneus ventricosus]